MTTPPIPGIIPEATDLRRAAAMLIAADPMAFNAPAVADIIQQVKADLRITELMTGMAVLAYQTPDLATDAGQSALWGVYLSNLEKESNTDEQ